MIKVCFHLGDGVSPQEISKVIEDLTALSGKDNQGGLIPTYLCDSCKAILEKTGAMPIRHDYIDYD